MKAQSKKSLTGNYEKKSRKRYRNDKGNLLGNMTLTGKK
jgi:hypothetical protein